MKTLVALFCSLFCLVFVSVAVAVDLPRGVKIDFSDGSSVTRYDPESKARESLTGGIKNAVVAGPFASSQNGKILVWYQDKKIFAKELGKPGETYFLESRKPRYLSKEILEGKPRAIKNNPLLLDKKGNPVTSKTGAHPSARGATNLIPGVVFLEKDFPVPVCQNLVVSPDGTKIAYECQARGLAYIPVRKGDYTRVVLGNEETYIWLPMFDYRTDTCIAVNVLNTFTQQTFNEECIGHSNGAGGQIMFGNVAFFTPAPIVSLVPPNNLFKMSYQGSMFSIYSNSSHTGVIKPLGVDSPSFQDHLAWYTTKRNAHFPAFSKLQSWQKNERLIAVIYQTAEGWGPIDICDLAGEKSAFNLGSNGSQKPGIYTIVFTVNGRPFFLKSCEGLAFLPDGSLSFISERKLFIISGDKIREVIRNSSVRGDNGLWVANAEFTRKTGHQGAIGLRTVGGKPAFPKVPANNVLVFELVPVTDKVLGNKPYWTSDTDFIVRGYDNCLWFWKKKNSPEKLSGPISEYYGCCEGLANISQNPIAVVPEVIPTPKPSKVIGLVPELIPTPEGFPIPNGKYPEMRNSGEVAIELEKMASIGSLRLLWKNEAPERIILFVDSEGISVNKRAVPFVIMQEKDIDTVLNPVKYKLVEDESSFGIETKIGVLMLFKTESEFVLAQLVKMDNGKLIVKYKVRPYQLVKTAQR